jgi:hypothetical protein
MISKETKLNWIDVSYANDECDSIECEELDLMVFFPNFIELNDFILIKGSNYGMSGNEEMIFNNLKDLYREIDYRKQE